MSVTWAWILLVFAGLLEVSWVIGLKYSEGFTKLIPSVFTILALSLSMYALSRVAQVLPIGTAYGVWVGIGALGAAAFGIIMLNESASVPRLIFLAMLFVAIIGLKVTAE